MTIVQPRNGGTSSETLSVKDLLAWGDKIKPIANLAYEGKGEFKAGEHCRFCRAIYRCKCYTDYQLAIAKEGLPEGSLLADEDIAEILSRVDSFVSWANGVKEYALQEAISGRKWPGYKLVEGKSTRHITDTDKAAKVLSEDGYSDIWKPRELLGITALEKLCGKKHFGELMASLIDKPPGAPKLVVESDPRPEWKSAENNFDTIDDDPFGDNIEDEEIPF